MTSGATIERQALTAQRHGAGVEYSVESVEQPDGPRARERVLRRLETVVAVTDGVVYVVAGENEWVLTPGDEAVIAAGVAHRRWNAGDTEARFVETFRQR
jgi:quercetin dioxygenase-like cupin family protein